MTNMVTIFIEDLPYQVADDINLLQACLSLKLDIPYFCWHPAMGSVGACRQCAVMQYQNEDDTRGRLVMSCMTPVSEGMRLSFNNEKAETFRATNIEAIMTNHPHDCPVCEEGGDCHLQDMTLLSGHIKRRYPGTKRTHNNQYLGPLLNHEMNRCIGCYRCVRFYRDYCGGNDLNVFSSKNNIYFGRAEPGILENEFSGNLAEVCPTGVFTDKPFSQHYIRKWDLQSSPSICSHCSVGCNTYVTERGGIIRKINNRYNEEINGHFLCDRGRFAYQHVNHESKLTQVWSRAQQQNSQSQQTHVLDDKKAHSQFSQWLNEADAQVVGIGSARSSIENNAALHKLVGANNFYAGIASDEFSQLQLLIKTYKSNQLSLVSLNDIEQSDAVLLVGEDVTQTAPRLALSIRQMTKNAGIAKAAKMGIKHWQDEAVRNISQDEKSPLIIINTHETKLADVAKHNLNLAPNKQLELLLEIEAYLTNEDAKTHFSATLLSETKSSDIAIAIANELLTANNPVVVTGTHSFDITLLSACLRVSILLKDQKENAGFYCATSAINALGLSLLVQPDDDIAHDLDSLIENIKSKPPTLLIIMETDLYRYCSNEKLTTYLDKIKHIVVIEQILTDTVKMADLVLPAASFAEQHGSWLNNEARLQRAYAVMPASEMRQTPVQWLAQHNSLDDEHNLYRYIQNISPLLQPIMQFYTADKSDFSVASQPMRSSARTAFFANIDVKEYAPKRDEKSNLTFSMEGVAGFRQQTLNNSQHKITTPVTGVWSPKWNSNQAVNKTLSNTLNESSVQDKADLDIGLNLDLNLSLKIFDHINTNRFEVPASKIDSPSQPLTNISICPHHHIYSNDELSDYSSSIQQLRPDPVISLNQKQANDLAIKSGENLTITSNNYNISLPCLINNTLADKVVLVPFTEFMRLGANKQVSSNYSAGNTNGDVNG
ncbi:MAG: NADH-quinone oxidoreductase subunit NuoG [Colwellia sp.]|uniref:NADH-quinone oxidoreductase subunit NuoG n=1 Tax=Colwellia sp. TaxID=56799 RepID=UPI0025BB4ADC|nr:NADH-quinone oxidoreductase subunit NuoG [Colwellia sp.]NQZ27010.1 NADH-quinone oxidoreductase subunit NuoG [Colwellia sp.]